MKSNRSQSIIKACAVLGVAVVGVTLAGCSQTDVTTGAAAVVNGQRIEVRDLQTGTDEIAALLPSQQVGQTQVLYSLITGPLWINAAADAGVGVSTQNAQDAIDATAKKNGVDPCVGSCSSTTVEFVQASLAQSKLENSDGTADVVKKVADEITKLSVDVNPRYGTFDLSTAGSPGWMSADFAWLPAPTATPAAGQ